MLKHLCIDDWRAHRLAADVTAAQVTAHSELNAAFTALGIALTALLLPVLMMIWQ